MQKYKVIRIIAAAMAMLVIILDSRCTFEGALQGINMCIYTVIPSLFPLFVLSHYLTQALSGTELKFLQRFTASFGVPKGGESLFLVGSIGGYPVGAQCIKNAYDSGVISKSDSQRLLGFCSNAGPAFIFGMAGRLFESAWIPWLLWLIQILSAILVGFILPEKRKYQISQNSDRNISILSSMKQSLHALSNVCGWVILFRMISNVLSKWFLWYFPLQLQVSIYALIELVNGCNAMYMLQNEGLRMVFCSVFLSAGGLCVCMQTMSVVGELGIESYLKGKLLQTVFSTILSCFAAGILFPGNPWMVLSVLLFPVFIIILNSKLKKSVAFKGRMIYNTKKSL